MNEVQVASITEEVEPVKKRCALCAEQIEVIAKRCPFCGQFLPPLDWGERGEKEISPKFKRVLYRIEHYSEKIYYALGQWALLDILTRASIMAAIALFFLSIPGQIRQRQNDAWQVVFLSSDAGGGQATIRALEELNRGFLGLFEKVSLAGIDLQGCELSGIQLPEADLSRANLHRAHLIWANLRRANLWQANLREADLTGADLGGAYLQEADLRGAELTAFTWLGGETDLTGADLGGADLRGANLRYANLRGANLTGADLRGADLRGVGMAAGETDLTKASLHEANLKGARYNGATIWPDGFTPPSDAIEED